MDHHQRVITRICGDVIAGLCCAAVIAGLLDINVKSRVRLPITATAGTIQLQNILPDIPEPETEEEENPFEFAVMRFTTEEAETLLQRFEDEWEEARRKAEKEARRAEEEARRAAAAKQRASYGAASYYAGAVSYTENDVFMLATIIGQETAGIDEEVMMAVGNVVINRIYDSRFPNNMYDVLTAPMQYGHDNGESFYFNSYVSETNRQRCMDCARRLLNGERVIPANVVWQAGFMQGNGLYAYYDTYPFGTYLCY